MSRRSFFACIAPVVSSSRFHLHQRGAAFGALILPLALSLAVAGCSSTPPAPPAKPPAPTASRSTAKPAPRTKSAQAKKSPPANAGTPASRDTDTATVAKAERIFLRPARGAVIQNFDGRNKKGVDFAGALGDPVRAARDGQVVYAASTLRGYGRLVMVKHDGNYLTAYAHNSELLVKNGDKVKRGQVIARMGSSESDRVKLHFELRRRGTAVNPVPYFSAEDAGPAGADPG
jgi:lipoprotein NlpD